MPFHRKDNCSLKILQYFVEFGEPFTSNNKNRKFLKKNIQNSFGIEFMISQELVNNSLFLFAFTGIHYSLRFKCKYLSGN